MNTSPIPTIFVHGWGLHSGIWQTMLTEFAHSVAVDLSGFGDNRRVVEPYSIAALATDLLEHVPGPINLVGWSLGGLVAMQAALQAPERVQRLVLVASSPCFQQQSDWPGIKPEVLSQFQSQLVTAHHETLERFLAIQAMGSDTARQDVRQLRSLLASKPEPELLALQGGLNILQKVDWRESFTQLTMPVSVILGRLDALVPVAIADWYRAQPNCQVDILRKASHAPFISHREEFVSILKQRLSV